MELVVRKADLLRELQLLQGIVERKITKPVLGNILVEAGEQDIRLYATDLDVGMRGRCEASVSKAGSVTIPAKKLFEIVRALPDTDVRIEEGESGVRVAADRFESRMATEPVEEYPLFPTEGDEGGDELGAAGLRQMVAKTQFAVTGEDTRYFLNGALLVLKRDTMSLVATDGHRLALITVPRSEEGLKKGQKETGDEERVILPKKTLAELGKLLADSDAKVDFSKTVSHLFFSVGERILVSRVIDGNFPAYDRVIPKGNDKRVEFDRDRLTSAVRRVALLSNERSRAVTFQMDPGQVEVSSRSQEFGDAREILVVDYDGPSLKICFNAQYVLDFLNAVETERVSLDFKDDVSQSLMQPIGSEGYDYMYVIMPMRL